MTAPARQDVLLDVEPEEPTPAPAKPVRVKVGAARESQGCRDIYFQATGNAYRDNPKDAVVWKSLRAKHSVAEIEERWRVALVAKGWAHCDNIWQLGTKWNELGALIAKPVASPLGACAACGAPGECAMWELPVCYRCYGAWLDEPQPDYAKAHEVVRAWAVKRRGGER